MVDIKNKRCLAVGCAKLPTFAMPGEAHARYCVSHKEDGMEDVKHKRCLAIGCAKQPAYAMPGETRARYCATHKDDGMENVKSRRCLTTGCVKQAHYRWPYRKLSHCSSHKQPGQIKVKERCVCGKPPTHSQSDLSEFYCFDCSRGKESLVDHRIACERCELKLTPNFLFQEGSLRVCETCYDGELCHKERFSVSDTSAPVTVAKKQRIEEIIVELLEQQIATKSRSWHSSIVEVHKDKAVGGSSCDSRRRPDLYLLLAGKQPLKLVIEVDEYQHKSYSCACEQGRMLEIANELLVPDDPAVLVFVRLNPDSYKVKGVSKRSQRGKAEIAKRVAELDRVVQLVYERDIVLNEGKHCAVAYLYYDDYNGLELQQL